MDLVISNIKFCTTVVILSEDRTKVLAVSRKENHNDFGLIGGKVDPEDATVIDAAVRETKEETGIDVAWGDLYPILQIHKNGYMSVTYLATKYSGEIHTDEPHVVAWKDFEVIENGSFGQYNKLVKESLIDMGILTRNYSKCRIIGCNDNAFPGGSGYCVECQDEKYPEFYVKKEK